MTAFVGPSSRSAGDVLTAAIWNQDVVDNFNEAFPDGGEAWATWTPTVKFGATTATVANDSKIMRIGRLVVCELRIRFTNLNSGSGTLTILKPYASRRADTAAVVHDYVPTPGVINMFDISGGNAYHGFAISDLADGSDFAFHTLASPSVTISNTAPFTIAVGALNTGDEMTGTFWYEAAS